MKDAKIIPTLAFGLCALVAAGCSHRQIVGDSAGTAGAGASAASTASQQTGRYAVRPGDTLWGISEKSEVYGDPFEWPLLFKANRGQIQDPDLIYPKQDLRIQKDATPKEKQDARDQASKTPAYVPHAKPRETLPVNYF